MYEHFFLFFEIFTFTFYFQGHGMWLHFQPDKRPASILTHWHLISTLSSLLLIEILMGSLMSTFPRTIL